MRIAENKVKVEGILSENSIEYGSFVKEGKSVDTIKGTIKIKVDQEINGIPVSNEVPVSMFAQKYTKEGKLNPAYESIERIKNEFVSIAAAGTEEGADRIRVSGKVEMNEYYNANKQLIAFPRISSSFATKVEKDRCHPEASFVVEMVVANKGYEIDAEGIETERYKIKGIIPKFNDRVDVIDFVCANENVINAVSTYWSENDTVRATGRLNFTSTTEVVREEQGFGEPITRTRTISCSDLVITGGSQTPLEGEFAFDISEIQNALTERKNKLEAQKEKDVNRSHQRTAPAPTSSNTSLDLGF